MANDRLMIVTGGSRGIGLGVTLALLDKGYRVLVLARSSGEHKHPRLSFLHADLAKVEEFPTLVKAIHSHHGYPYGLVNNAGISHEALLARFPVQAVHDLLWLNVTSPVLLTKCLIGPMMAAAEGRIINISSIVAETGYPGLSVYASTKAAMIGFTKSLARELGPCNITVNAVAPGFIDTALTHGLTPEQLSTIRRRSALKRMATPADVGAAVAYLASDEASNVTGTVLTIDAGSTA